MRFVIALAILITTMAAAQANGELLTCGNDANGNLLLGASCAVAKPIYFNTTVIKFRINPRLPRAKIVKDYLLATINNQSMVVKIKFDGYLKPDRKFEGIYIDINNEYNVLGFARWKRFIETESNYESGLAVANLTKWAIAYDLNKFLLVVLHEFGHCLGLAHSDDINSFMYHSPTEAQGITETDINNLNDLYSSVGN